MEDRDEKISDAQATEQTTPEVQSIKDMEDQDSEKHPGSGTAPQGTEHQYISGIKLWTLLGSLTLVCFLMMLDMSIIVTAIPRITSDFHSLTDVGWYGSAYLISSCALQPLTGKFYTHFSSKYTFITFLGVFEFGSVLCGAAQSSEMLIIGRAIAGIGSSGLSNGTMTIMAAAAPLYKRPMLFGIMMAISQLGIVGGPLIGGALTQYASWRWCFYINLPIGGLAVLIVLLMNIPFRKPVSTDAKTSRFGILSKLDLLGFVFFAGFAIMFLLALDWGGTTYPWNSAIIIGLFCGSGGAAIVFAAWEYRVGDEAMIPPSIVRKRIVLCSCMVIFFFFSSMLLLSYYLPIYFQAVKGTSPALSGVYVLPAILSQIAMAPISGYLVGKLGYYLPWSVASTIAICVSAGLLSTLTPHTSTVQWVFYQIIGGLGRGSGMQMPIIAIQNALPPEQTSVSMALVMFFQTFGGSIFLTIAETIFEHSLVSALHKYAPSVNSESVVNAGATAFRQVVAPAQLPGVLEAYAKSVDHNFYLAIATSGMAFAFCWGIGWKKISKKKVIATEADV